MTRPVQIAPFELEQKRVEKERMHDVKNNRLGLPKGSVPIIKHISKETKSNEDQVIKDTEGTNLQPCEDQDKLS